MEECEHDKFGGDHHCCDCGKYAPDIVAKLQKDIAFWKGQARVLVKITDNFKAELAATK